jgi:hypothetical protein
VAVRWEHTLRDPDSFLFNDSRFPDFGVIMVTLGDVSVARYQIHFQHTHELDWRTASEMLLLFFLFVIPRDGRTTE